MIFLMFHSMLFSITFTTGSCLIQKKTDIIMPFKTNHINHTKWYKMNLWRFSKLLKVALYDPWRYVLWTYRWPPCHAATFLGPITDEILLWSAGRCNRQETDDLMAQCQLEISRNHELKRGKTPTITTSYVFLFSQNKCVTIGKKRPETSKVRLWSFVIV